MHIICMELAFIKSMHIFFQQTFASKSECAFLLHAALANVRLILGVEGPPTKEQIFELTSARHVTHFRLAQETDLSGVQRLLL